MFMIGQNFYPFKKYLWEYLQIHGTKKLQEILQISEQVLFDISHVY